MTEYRVEKCPVCSVARPEGGRCRSCGDTGIIKIRADEPTGPDLIQPIIGFRQWQMDGGLLRSTGAGNALWEPDVALAECLLGVDLAKPGYEEDVRSIPHDAPGQHCGCGLYAWHKPQWLRNRRLTSNVVGAVAAWGDIQVHQSGFRAEKACVTVLCLDEECLWFPNRKEQIEKIAATYQAEVVPIWELQDAARKHGIETPSELRPIGEPKEPVERASVRGLTRLPWLTSTHPNAPLQQSNFYRYPSIQSAKEGTWNQLRDKKRKLRDKKRKEKAMKMLWDEARKKNERRGLFHRKKR